MPDEQLLELKRRMQTAADHIDKVIGLIQDQKFIEQGREDIIRSLKYIEHYLRRD